MLQYLNEIIAPLYNTISTPLVAYENSASILANLTSVLILIGFFSKNTFVRDITYISAIVAYTFLNVFIPDVRSDFSTMVVAIGIFTVVRIAIRYTKETFVKEDQNLD